MAACAAVQNILPLLLAGAYRHYSGNQHYSVYPPVSWPGPFPPHASLAPVTSMRPKRAAKCSGVHLFLSRQFTSAPALMRAAENPTWPSFDEMWRGDSWLLTGRGRLMSGADPASSRALRTTALPPVAALCSCCCRFCFFQREGGRAEGK